VGVALFYVGGRTRMTLLAGDFRNLLSEHPPTTYANQKFGTPHQTVTRPWPPAERFREYWHLSKTATNSHIIVSESRIFKRVRVNGTKLHNRNKKSVNGSDIFKTNVTIKKLHFTQRTLNAHRCQLRCRRKT